MRRLVACLTLALLLQFGAAHIVAQGRGGGLQLTEPSPLDFNDHEGYVSIFDGKTLDGWDGNPKFWRVEDGAIVGESTPERPSGNSYIAYRRMEAKDSGKSMTTFASPGSFWSALSQVYVGTSDGTVHAFGFLDERR